MKRFQLFVLLAVAALASSASSCAKLDNFKWPDVAKCGPDIGDLVGIVTQLLLSDAGQTEPTPSTKSKLEQLGRQHGASTILCLVDQLARDWTAVGASASPERFNAGMRGKVWLSEIGTQIRRSGD